MLQPNKNNIIFTTYGRGKLVLYHLPEINSYSSQNVYPIGFTQYFTAQDIAGVFSFAFDPEAVIDECGFGPGPPSVDFNVIAQNETDVTFSFSAFPYPDPGSGTGTVSNNHFNGTITTDIDLIGCTAQAVFTIEFDILGPNSIGDPLATFQFTPSSAPGTCLSFIDNEPCTSEFIFVIQ